MEIPYLCTNSIREIERVEGSIYNAKELFGDGQLLSKIVIWKESQDRHIVGFYVHHCLWDNVSSEILVDLFKHSLEDNDGKFEHEETFADYVVRKRTDVIPVDMYDSEENIICKMKTFKNVVQKNSDKIKLVEVTKELTKQEIREILAEPNKWMLKKYYKALENLEIKEIPFGMTYHGREPKTLRTLGCYYDYVPSLYRVDSDCIFGGQQDAEKYRNSQENYELYLEKMPLDSVLYQPFEVNFIGITNINLDTPKNVIKILGTQMLNDESGIIAKIYGNVVQMYLPVYVKKHTPESKIIETIKEAFNM